MFGNVSKTRYNCRLCGKLFCDACSKVARKGAVLICEHRGESEDLRQSLSDPNLFNLRLGAPGLTEAKAIAGGTGVALQKPLNSARLWIECQEIKTGTKFWICTSKMEEMELNHMISYDKPILAPATQIPLHMIETIPGRFFDPNTGESRVLFTAGEANGRLIGCRKQVPSLLGPQESSGEGKGAAAAPLRSLSNLNWNLDNQVCEQFRQDMSVLDTLQYFQSARALSEREHQFQLAFPEYVYVMPKALEQALMDTNAIKVRDGKLCNVVVSIYYPSAITGNANAQDTYKTKKAIKPTITVECLFERIKSKIRDKRRDARHYMFKVVGHEEYLSTLSLPLLSYEYIQNCLRKREEPRLKLVYRPEIFRGAGTGAASAGPLPRARPLSLWRQAEHQFRTHLQSEMLRGRGTILPIGEVHSPFALKVHSVSGINKSTLPRFSAATPLTPAYLYVKVRLYFGGKPIDRFCCQTGYRALNLKDKRADWQQLITPQKNKNWTDKNRDGGAEESCNFSELPHNTRVFMGLYQMSSTDGAETLLAYVNTPLNNSRGELASGFIEHKLWAMPEFDANQVASAREEQDFVARMGCSNDNYTTKRTEQVKLSIEYDVFPKSVRTTMPPHRFAALSKAASSAPTPSKAKPTPPPPPRRRASRKPSKLSPRGKGAAGPPGRQAPRRSLSGGKGGKRKSLAEFRAEMKQAEAKLAMSTSSLGKAPEDAGAAAAAAAAGPKRPRPSLPRPPSPSRRQSGSVRRKRPSLAAPSTRAPGPPAGHATEKRRSLMMMIREKASKNGPKHLMQVLEKLKPLESVEQHRDAIWKNRAELSTNARCLSAFLASVDWGNRAQREEAHMWLYKWKQPPAQKMIKFLSSQFTDQVVRRHAVERLDELQDKDLESLLLQLTQALKFESQHNSPLARFLLSRALMSPHRIGHFLFWHLRSELHNDNLQFCERCALVLEAYTLRATARDLERLIQQSRFLDRMEAIALEIFIMVEKKKEKALCERRLHELLADVAIGSRLPITFNPRVESVRLVVKKCKYMSSKKLPLWLVFDNADPDDDRRVYLIFKSGDDLRQDILTLQMLRTMDRFWVEAGLDMRLSPYTCVATGVNKNNEGVGVIEVVVNSDTISRIQINQDGAKDKWSLTKHLTAECRKAHKPFSEARENFIVSCAGYCVFSYCLGVGDRHNGNIMMTKSGLLFHIDFGHFLGNFKKKFGFNRERASFVFTPEMATLIGGSDKYESSDNYKRFVKLCQTAFNVCRKHAHYLSTLFQIMTIAQMPELSCDQDINYLYDMLKLDSSEEGASAHMKSEIKCSVHEKWRIIDNALHNMKHG